MKSKLGFIFLVGLVLLAIFLRFYKLSTNFIFDSDQGDDMFKLVEMSDNIKSGKFDKLPLIGEAGTDNTGVEIPTGNYNIYTGVFFLYLILPFAWLANFNPLGLTIFFAILNLLAIPFIYLSGKELVNKRVGFFAALLFSTSYWMNAFSRAIWTPSPVPFFVAVSIYLMLLIKRGKNSVWPLFLFSVASISQMHDSGYFYAFLFIVLIFVLKLPKPKKILTTITSTILFLFPVLPTIIYEFKTNFRFTHSLINIFTSSSAGLNIVDIGVKFWDFWITVINPWQYNTYLIDVYGLLGILATIIIFAAMAISLFGAIIIFPKGSDLKKILYVFLIAIFALPSFTKSFYLDSSRGLVLSGSVFSLIGAMPFVFIWHSYILDYFWSKGFFAKYLSLLILVTVIAVNILFIEKNVWTKILDPRFSYGDKVKIALELKNNLGNRNYSLDFIDIDRYGSREYLYLFDYYKIKQPVYFKGRKDAKSSFIDYVLQPGEPDVYYLIINRIGEKRIEPNDNYNFVAQSSDLRLYIQK